MDYWYKAIWWRTWVKQLIFFWVILLIVYSGIVYLGYRWKQCKEIFFNCSLFLEDLKKNERESRSSSLSAVPSKDTILNSQQEGSTRGLGEFTRDVIIGSSCSVPLTQSPRLNIGLEQCCQVNSVGCGCSRPTDLPPPTSPHRIASNASLVQKKFHLNTLKIVLR